MHNLGKGLSDEQSSRVGAELVRLMTELRDGTAQTRVELATLLEQVQARFQDMERNLARISEVHRKAERSRCILALQALARSEDPAGAAAIARAIERLRAIE